MKAKERNIPQKQKVMLILKTHQQNNRSSVRHDMNNIPFQLPAGNRCYAKNIKMTVLNRQIILDTVLSQTF